MIELYVGCVLAAAYIVRVLLFDGSTGPFESNTELIVDNGTSADRVDLWDRIRRLFGVYSIQDAENGYTEWHTTVRADLWRCPKCLSFWLTLFVSVPFFLLTQEPALQCFFTAPLIHLSMVFCVQFLVFIQLYIEGNTPEDA